MIVDRIYINGYKRLEKARTYLDRKLIAIIGPNEAGKSSFLSSLLAIESSREFEKNELSKSKSFNDDDEIISIDYLLEADELDIAKEIGGIGEPSHYRLVKQKNGELVHSIVGKFTRDISHRTKLVNLINSGLRNKRLDKFLQSEIEVITDEEESESSLNEILKTVASEVNNNDKNIDLSSTYETLLEFFKKEDSSRNKTSAKFCEDLLLQMSLLKSEETKEHPKSKLLDEIHNLRPNFIFFDNDERYLKSSYTLEELQSPPGSLANLIAMAEVNLSDLEESISNDDSDLRLKLNQDANDTLKSKFLDSWSQSDIYPQILVDEGGLKIKVTHKTGYIDIAERSDGLKQFISLRAFINSKSFKVPPVLLIDEAEVHLHYNAQADLIKQFEKQKIVKSVIYTTHSAGCLPSDLGSSTRAITPVIKDGEDTGVSKIHNSIWSNHAGFSPILFAMGANIIGFTMARKAIFTEGPSETILLPRLFKEVLETDHLDLQIAPGIAIISKNNAKSFEFESAKESFLVDGDKGGDANRAKLIAGGVDKSKILQLAKNRTIEDYVRGRILIDSINEEFKRVNLQLIDIKENELPTANRIKYLEDRCKAENINLPSKIRIAENITKYPSTKMIYDPKQKNQLKLLYEKFQKILS